MHQVVLLRDWSFSALLNSDLYSYRGEWLSADEYRQPGGFNNRKVRTRFKEIIALNIFYHIVVGYFDTAHFTIVLLLAEYYPVLDHY